MSTRHKVGIALGILLVLSLGVLAYGYYVWPTPWRPFTAANGAHKRVNRFNGRREVEIGDGWFSERTVEPERYQQKPGPPADK